MVEELKTKTENLLKENEGNLSVSIDKITSVNKTKDGYNKPHLKITSVNLKDDGTPFTEDVKLEDGTTRYVPQEKVLFLKMEVARVMLKGLKL